MVDERVHCASLRQEGILETRWTTDYHVLLLVD
jgi:hypothetical protein